MIKGAIIAICLLVVGDVALNHGEITRSARTHLASYAAASSNAVTGSIFAK